MATATLALHWLLVVLLSLRVVARRLPVGVSLAWLAVLYAIPFVGAGAYLFFGGKRLGRQRLALQTALQPDIEDILTSARERFNAPLPDMSSAGAALYRQALGLLRMPALPAYQTRLLQDDTSVFNSLVEDIDRATKSCRLGFYIWHDGGRADDVGAALLRARARGIECRLLVDALGSAKFIRGPRSRALRAAGVEIVVSLPRSFGRRADLRNHRKIVVIDDRVAYTGSQNLVDPRFFKQDAGVGQWVDAVMRLEGPVAPMLASVFEHDRAVERASAFARPDLVAFDETPTAVPGSLMQVVPSGPSPFPDAIRQLLLTAIYSARHSLTLTTPYFVPDEAIHTALCSAAHRGVKVTVIVPAHNDSRMVRYASEAHFDDLMDAGIRIALFSGGLLHTKSMVVDEEITIFGSVNLDMRSFWLNFEISLFIYDQALSAEIAALQTQYLAQSAFMDSAEWTKRPRGQRFLQNAARLIGPLL